jgi:hypothetical protein
MILDGLLQFSAAAGDTPTATGVSTNVIDLHMSGIPVLASGQGARDMGIGDDPALKLLVLITATFTGLTSLQIALQGAPDNGSGAPAAFVSWWTGPVTTLASGFLTAGTRLYDMDMPRPPAGQPVPRFLQMSYTIAGAGTGGALKAFIVLDRDDQMYNTTNNAIMGGYPAGVIVAN